jgi:ribosomal protein L12E/L44/L45/RPP1/RPP2
MIKKILIGLVVLALIAGAAVYFLGSMALNKGIKTGVESVGPKVTQTPVTLDAVNISFLSGSGSLKGLKVGNTEGFKSENIFALGQIDIKVDTGSVFSDKIIIDEIIINAPEISYEKTLTSSNIKELLKNIEAFTGAADETGAGTEVAAEESGAKKQVVIRKLVIEEGTIYVGALGVGQTVKLPRIEMNDIGEGGDRMTMAEAIDMVLKKVLSNIGPAIAGAADLGKEAANAIKTQGLEKVDQATEKAGEAVKDGLNKLFGK